MLVRDRCGGAAFTLKPLFTSLSQKNEKRCNDLRCDAARRVNEHIAHGGGAARNERLVIFIERGIARNDQNRHQRPAQVHAFFAGANAAQDQHAENEIFGQVCAFADDVVHGSQGFRRSVRKKKAQDGDDVCGWCFPT